MLLGALLGLALGLTAPREAELDFTPLTPLPGAVGYDLTLTFTALDGRSLTFPIKAGASAEPEEILVMMTGGFRTDGNWSVRVDGNKLGVSGHGGSPLVGVKIGSTGPRPTLTWALLPPKKK